jgi:hypothetical protein
MERKPKYNYCSFKNISCAKSYLLFWLVDSTASLWFQWKPVCWCKREPRGSQHVCSDLETSSYILSCDPQKNNPSGLPFLSILTSFQWPFLFLSVVTTKADYHDGKHHNCCISSQFTNSTFILHSADICCVLAECLLCRSIIIIIVDTEENKKCPIFYGNESSGDVVFTDKNS